jgi:zinc/manganese transport system permease protein
VRTGFATVGYQPNWLEILDSAFMRNAMIGGTIVALAAGVIGYFVVVRQSAFAAHALAHIGLPGATGAVLLGLSPVFGLGVFCVAGAMLISVLGQRASERDVVTGTVLAFATGLGLFFNSLATKSSSTMTNVLFGNLLAITGEQLMVFAALLAVVAITVGVVYRPLLYSSINSAVAQAKGIPVGALSLVFIVLLALTVTMAIRTRDHTRRHRDRADPPAGAGDGNLNRTSGGLCLAGADRLGDVQCAAELFDRHDRHRGVAGGLAAPSRQPPQRAGAALLKFQGDRGARRHRSEQYRT